MTYDFSDAANMTNEQLSVIKNEQLVVERMVQNNRINFLKAIFLVCPLCGEDTFVQNVESDHFTTKCKCAEWKISFKIREI